MSPSFLLEQFAPYAVPPVVATVAIVPVYRDLVAKSFEQKGLTVPKMTIMEGLKLGFKAAPITGALVGAQLVLKEYVDNKLKKHVKEQRFLSVLTTVGSPAVVGFVTAPILAAFNGQTMGVSWMNSLRQLRGRRGLNVCMAFALQETACVAGLTAGSQMNNFGNDPVASYATTFTVGVLGSLAGHAFNTSITRWQSDMTVFPNQLMWGAVRRARAIGFFAVFIKFGSETLNSYAVRDAHG
jgi:hypothetical protein